MTKCPSCQATLPDGAYFCQFCQTNFGAAPGGRMPSGRISTSQQYTSTMPGTPGWVLPAYYGIAAWWMLDGGWLLYRSLQSSGFFAVFGIAVGGITAIAGLGLIARIDVIRGIVNVLCFLQIIDGAFGLLGGFLMTGIFGILGVIAMIMSVVRIAFACLMIYLIGETDAGCRV